MEQRPADISVLIFSTCPQSVDLAGEQYVRHVIDVARWSEQHGCKGILIYADNRLVDPWLLAQVIVQHTTTLCPLVAVQPLYMHPYSVANMVGSLAHLYERRVYLNMVAGGFKNDLTALNDTTPHDRRYDRLKEYTLIIKQLIQGDAPLSFDGEFYRVSDLRLTPAVPAALLPGIFMSGSSDAGLAACRAVGGTAIRYPHPADEEEALSGDLDQGMRVGIITREHEEEAWAIAYERFPDDRRGQIAHQMAMKVSDSVWHKQLSRLSDDYSTGRTPYWMVPFQNYKTFCPYLVGSYGQVSAELARYMGLGYRTFILDIPPNEEELHHTAVVFQRAIETLSPQVELGKQGVTPSRV